MSDPMSGRTRRSRWRWWLLAAGVAVGMQAWSLVRGALAVRAVLYNEGPAGMEETVLGCAGASDEIGGLEAEESRYVWFRPAERTAVVGLVWRAAGERHEGAWAVERGERLTLRVRSDGEVTVSREQALGRKILDAVAGE